MVELSKAHLRPNPCIEESLFFPDNTNEVRIGSWLMRAHTSVDIAIFAFTNNVLAEAVKRLHRRGV